MPYIPRRPAALAHISDEAAAKALSRHFGAMVPAARELGISAPELRRLTWANPAILDASHERMSLFVFCRKDEIMRGLYSSRGSERRRAIAQMAANPGLFGDVDQSAFALLAPAPRGRRRAQIADDSDDRRARDMVDREVATEQAAERERELILERDRDAAADRERLEVMFERRSAPSNRVMGKPGRATPASAGRVTERSPARDSGAWAENAKYAHVRGGLTRRR